MSDKIEVLREPEVDSVLVPWPEEKKKPASSRQKTSNNLSRNSLSTGCSSSKQLRRSSKFGKSSLRGLDNMTLSNNFSRASGTNVKSI